MKLLTRTNRIYFTASAILFIIAGITLYIILSNIIRHEQDEKLLINKDRVKEKIAQTSLITLLPPVIEVEELNKPVKSYFYYKDTIVFDPVETEDEPFRELTSYEEINGKHYRITVRSSRLESHDLQQPILLSIAGTFLLMLLLLFRLNKYIAQTTWQTFYQNLEKLKSFSLQQKEQIQLDRSDITEFKELNTVIENLTNKVISDYQSLKSFTENASHEIQTPLAIILSKVESLMQESSLPEGQSKQLGIIYRSAMRLSKLNEGLLLLTKIENNQFAETEIVYFNKIISQQIEFLQEFASLSGLQLELADKGNFYFSINKTLAEILIKNLLDNAIKHTEAPGVVRIEIFENKIDISNTANASLQDHGKLFQRFKKENPSSSSLGLGLAIVKDICENYHLHISYSFSGTEHIFTISA